MSYDLNRQPIYSTSVVGLQATNSASVLDEPTFQFSVLTCHSNFNLVKTIYADGTVKPYDDAGTFQFKYCEVMGVENFARALNWLAPKSKMAMIYGQLLPGLTGWQRRLLRSNEKYSETITCPPRSYLIFDLDGVEVPAGLGLPNRLSEAGYYIRDKILAGMFYQVRCVVSVTASTGLKGPTEARIRFFIPLPSLVESRALQDWAKEFKAKRPELRLDPNVFVPNQFVYTGRPIFDGHEDPVPPECRVAVLDGTVKYFAYIFPAASEPVVCNKNGSHVILRLDKRCQDVPAELMDLTAQDAGAGVHPILISRKAEQVKEHWIQKLKGCGRPGSANDAGRNTTLAHCAWSLWSLAAEGEMTETWAIEAYFEAANGIWNGDKKYGYDAIAQRLKEAMAKVGRRR
jgi:hypothetical protein